MNTNKEQINCGSCCKTEPQHKSKGRSRTSCYLVYAALIHGAVGQADFSLARTTEGRYIWYFPLEGHGNSYPVTNVDYLVLQMGCVSSSILAMFPCLPQQQMSFHMLEICCFTSLFHFAVLCFASLSCSCCCFLKRELHLFPQRLIYLKLFGKINFLLYLKGCQISIQATQVSLMPGCGRALSVNIYKHFHYCLLQKWKLFKVFCYISCPSSF